MRRKLERKDLADIEMKETIKSIRSMMKEIDKRLDKYDRSVVKEKVKCELCERREADTKHHPIPRNIIKKINPNSKITHKSIMLCKPCEIECHHGFLSYLINQKKCDGYNRLDALKYTLLKGYLKSVHNKVWVKCVKFMDKFITHAFKEFKKELKEVKR